MHGSPELSLERVTQDGRMVELTVSCRACGVLHRPADGLAFAPVCDACGEDHAQSRAAQHFHPLTEAGIADVVRAASPGSFELGYRDGASFRVFYVGRSDSDVGAILRAWVDAPSRPSQRRASPFTPWRARATQSTRLGPGALDFAALGADSAYTHFSFRYTATSILAYERECRAFHEHGGADALDNRRHPVPPSGSAWACPIRD